MCVFSTSDVPVYGTAPWHIIEWQINACIQIVFTLHGCRVESGSDDLGYLGHLGHFLVGQVGLIHKLNYLDVTQIFNRSHVL